MTNNIKLFEEQFEENFPNIDKTTLSKIKNGKLRIDLGGSLKNTEKRIEQAKLRINEILKFCLSESKIWIHLILWDRLEEVNLVRAGLNLKLADLVTKKHTPDHDILVIYTEKHFEDLISPIILCKLNSELAKSPSADITFYIIDFDAKLIINIYDDRGMDIYSTNSKYMDNVASKFQKWLL